MRAAGRAPSPAGLRAGGVGGARMLMAAHPGFRCAASWATVNRPCGTGNEKSRSLVRAWSFAVRYSFALLGMTKWIGCRWMARRFRAWTEAQGLPSRALPKASSSDAGDEQMELPHICKAANVDHRAKRLRAPSPAGWRTGGVGRARSFLAQLSRHLLALTRFAVPGYKQSSLRDFDPKGLSFYVRHQQMGTAPHLQNRQMWATSVSGLSARVSLHLQKRQMWATRPMNGSGWRCPTWILNRHSLAVSVWGVQAGPIILQFAKLLRSQETGQNNRRQASRYSAKRDCGSEGLTKISFFPRSFRTGIRYQAASGMTKAAM